MAKLKLYGELTRGQIASVFAQQRHSAGWERGYSLKNERSTDDAVAAAMDGTYWVKMSHVNHDPVDAHWLKLRNYTARYAWVDGIVFEDWRGEHWAQYRSWELFEQWAARQGFSTLLCAVFTDNIRAIRWTEDRCGFLRIGTRGQASPRPDGTWGDVHVFAKRYGEDEALDIVKAWQWADEALQGAWRERETDSTTLVQPLKDIVIEKAIAFKTRGSHES